MIGEYEHQHEPATGSRWGIGSVLNTLDWRQVRAEVERESQARIVIVGLRGVGKSSLLNRLRGWPVSPVGDGSNERTPKQEDLGLFTLVDLPADGAQEPTWPTMHSSFSESIFSSYGEAGWTSLAEADLIIFMLDGGPFVVPHEGASADTLGLRPAEYQWFCRTHSLGRPLIAALNKSDLLDGRLGEVQAELERRLASSVIAVSAQEGTGIETGLLPRMLDACPDLAVPLGREMPAVRHQAAARLIRRAAIRSGLTGLEPVPLLDIPVHLAAQMRLLLRLAALHGQLGVGDGDRELLATVAGGLGLRLAVQQVAKLVPVFGWAVSGLLSGLSTWLLGRAAVAYFDGSLKVRRPTLQRLSKGSLKKNFPMMSLRALFAKQSLGLPQSPPLFNKEIASSQKDAPRNDTDGGKDRASGIGHGWITGLASRAGKLVSRRRAVNPSSAGEFRASSLEEVN
jgi:uncharacterized protein (DUF697 family)